MASLKVVTTPQQPTLKVQSAPVQPSLKVTQPNVPAKLPVTNQPAQQPSLTVQPAAPQPEINVDNSPRFTQLGELVKSKYPGVYDSYDSGTLGKIVATKYPGVYDQFIQSATTQEQPEQKQGFGLKEIAKNLIQFGLKLAHPALTPTIDRVAGGPDEVSKGAAKGAVSTVYNTAELGSKALEKITGVEVNNLELNPDIYTPTNTSQKIGFGIERAAEFAVPQATVAKGVREIEAATAATKLPKLAQTAINLAGRSGFEAATGAGMTALQGGDKDEIVRNAVISGAIPIAAEGLKTLSKGSTTLGKNIEYKLVKPTARDLKDGFKVDTIYKYELGGTLQQTAEKTNSLITELSKQLDDAVQGSNKKINVRGLINQTKAELTANKVKTFGTNKKVASAIETLADELNDIAPNGVMTAPQTLQLKRSVGKLGAWLYGARDPEANALETAANAFYTKLKVALENVLPPEAITINKQLTELIPVEHALIRRVPIDQRGNILGLSDIISALPAVNEIKNPANWWLFALNKLLKSGRFADLLVKTGTPTTRGDAATAIFGSVK